MGTYPGVLQSYRTENCPQESSFSPVKEIIPPDSITPGNRPETAKFGKSGGPLGNVPGNSYLCPTLSYSVSKGFCLPPLRRVIPGGIFFVPSGLPGSALLPPLLPGVRIKLPDTLQIRHKCQRSGGDMERDSPLEKLFSYLCL